MRLCGSVVAGVVLYYLGRHDIYLALGVLGAWVVWGHIQIGNLFGLNSKSSAGERGLVRHGQAVGLWMPVAVRRPGSETHPRSNVGDELAGV